MIESMQIKAKTADERRRMINAAIAIDFYNNQQRQYMEYVCSKTYPETWLDMQNYISTNGITQQIIDETAVLFQVPAEINVDTDNEEIKATFQTMLSDSEIWKKLIIADRMAELTGKVGLVPRWHTTDKRVVIDVITPDKCFVVQDKDDPTKASTVYYAVDRDTDTRLATPITIYAKWTRESYSEVQLNKDFIEIKTVTEPIPNQYGTIPVVWISPLIEVDSFWVDHGYPLIEGNININLRESNLDLALDFQSFSTLIVTGYESGKDIKVGITRRIDFDSGDYGNATTPDAKYITPDAKLDTVAQIINARKVTLAKQFGLSESAFNHDTASINSGYQLRLSKQGVITRNNLKQEIYRKPIIDLVKNATICYTKNTAFRFPEDIKIDVNFGKIVFDSNPIETVALQQQKIMSGMMSLADAIRENNPMFTQEEAIEEAKRIRDEQAQISGIASILPADLGI